MKKSKFKSLSYILIFIFIFSIFPLTSYHSLVWATDSIISTVAGNGLGNYSGDGGIATNAGIFNPRGIVIDGSGNTYITDYGNHRVRKVDTNGIITTVAGNGTLGYSGDGGAATSAMINNSGGLAVDSSGNLYIPDTNNHRVRKVDTSGIITTVAGNGTSGYSGDGGAATSAKINYPRDVAVDSSGNLYIADFSNSRVRKVDTNGIISTVAGNGISGYGGDGGPATSAMIKGAMAVLVDNIGNIYISDYLNYRVRKVDTSGIITTVAGNGVAGYSGDGGAATSAMIQSPSGLAIDCSGNIYICDPYNNRVRKVDTSGIITTVAGNGIAGFSGDGGPATSAKLYNPVDIAINGSGNLNIADTYNQRIRKVTFPTLSSDATLSNLSLSSGTLTPAFTSVTHSYTASVTGSVSSITVTPTVNESHATVTVNGNSPSTTVNLNIGDNVITIVVTAQDGTTSTYTVTVTRGDINLTAEGKEGLVYLSWTQNGFVSYAGYNIYRSDSASGTFVKLHTELISKDQSNYEDKTAQVGTAYYYKMTIVKNDSTETDYSNLASGTAVDTLSPVIVHTPITNAVINLPIQINADVTDNINVNSVKLYYRKTGTTAYAKIDMVKTTGDTYSATIDGSNAQPPGIDYYIEATDGVSTVNNGSSADPNLISIVDEPKMNSVTPNQGPIAGGTTVVITGTNFKSGANVSLDGVLVSNVTYISSSEIRFITTAHYPSTVDITVTNPDSAKSTMLRAFSYIETGVDVTIANAQGKLGQTIEVPVTISSVSGFKAADITLDYDKDILTALSARVGSLTNSFSISTNTNTAGQVIISMANPTQITGSGTIAYITFRVADSTVKTSSPLTLSSVTLNGGNITGGITNGLFTLPQKYSVSGSVNYYSNSTAVSGVNMALSGETNYTGTSSSDGSYNINNIDGGSYNLTASKNNEGTNITSYDASLILQYSSRLITLTDNQKIAADVNGDGNINSMDASAVLSKAVDLISLPFSGSGKVWTFVPSKYTYDNLNSNKTGQNFNAILIGDVSGNWGSVTGQSLAGAKASLQVAADNQATFNIGTFIKNSDGTISVPIRVNMTNANLYSVDMVLNYDSATENVVSVDKTALSSSFSIAYNSNTKGTLKISMASATPIPTDGDLVVVKFKLSKSKTQLAGINLVSVLINEGAVNSVIAESFKVNNITLSAGAALTPDFSPSITSYTGTVPYKTKSITITSIVEENGMLKTYKQQNNLILGENNISLTFKSSSGTVLTYTIIVTRMEK